MSFHIRQGGNRLLMELLWQVSCLKSPSCQTQRFLSQMFHHHPPDPSLQRGMWWLCRNASPTSFVLGAKRCFFNGWDVDLDGEILKLSEFCTSVAKSFELKRMYINDGCVSEAINWDSLLISSWFFISNNTWCVYGFKNFGFSSLSVLAFSVPCRTSLPLTGWSCHYTCLTYLQNTSFLQAQAFIQAQLKLKMPWLNNKIKRKAYVNWTISSFQWLQMFIFVQTSPEENILHIY